MSFGPIFAATSIPRIPRLAQRALVETLSPPLRKKNGVRNANETTRRRSCSRRCEAKNRDITSPRTNAGRGRLRVRARAQPHEQEEAREDELDLRLDHAIAVAREEMPSHIRQSEDERYGDQRE